MKRILILSGLAFSLAAARADLVIQQKIEGAMMNGTVTVKVKGNQVRTDIPSSPQGSMSTILDLNSGDQVMLMHQEKMAMKIPGARVKQMAENMRKERADAGTNGPPAKFTDTGKTEQVGEYNAEIYTWSGPDGEKQTVWVAKNFPDYSKIKTDMDKLEESPMAKISRGSAPDASTLPGMVVKTQTEMNGQKVTSTLVSAKEQTVDASVFETPKDYHEMTAPAVAPPPNQ